MRTKEKSAYQTYLVVAEEAVLPGVRALEGGRLGLGAHVVVVWVHKREGPAVEGHAEHSLLGFGPLLDEVVESVLDVEEEVLALLLGPGVEWRIVAGLAVPLAVVVVAHHVHVVLKKISVMIVGKLGLMM